MHRLTLLAALLCPALAAVSSCVLPSQLDQRQFTNLSDPLYHPDNPNAGRMVQVSFASHQYALDILGSDIRISGSYRYQRLAPHIAEIGMIEAHPAGPARYTLLLAYLTVSEGRFYTQHDGPIAPPQRQNSGRWAMQP
ncbi:hypothetical protein [Stenotrophomonas lactitubi]|uniref:hypothetical protein n=1 Tax=Stenotrophomonas lactitubi TaxID=2045214 RepID=UPI0020407AF4|nr:hypothetical protein [Stenotrophomonas lactitubi]